MFLIIINNYHSKKSGISHFVPKEIYKEACV